MKTIFVFSFIFLLCNLIFAQEYSFDVGAFEKKPYELICSIKFQPEIMLLNKSSKLYSLSFFNKESKDCWDEYSASIQIDGSYQISEYRFSSSLQNVLTYTTDDEYENKFSLFELYGAANISNKFSLIVGKKTVKWGKGYIWNPVAFAGRQKDINDIDAALEGYWMVKFDYVQSLSGFLQNFSITPVIIPVNLNLNEDFQDTRSINFILNTYFLIGNTDLDLYILLNETEFQKIGIGFARNILPNWEVHGEYVHRKEEGKKWLNSSYQIEQYQIETHNFLLGSRFLLPTNTTVILEYLHNDSGLDEKQMKNFYDSIDSAISESPTLVPDIKEYQRENMNNQFLMKNYLYLKISQPEPFGLLYFTPSVFVLHNLADNSEMIGAEFKYYRFDNFTVSLKFNFLIGGPYSEFGEKTSSKKVSLLLEYVF